MRVMILTKTKFDEPPRIRHQVAELLADRGNLVAFVQKPKALGRTEIERLDGGLEIWRSSELVHHQLRVSSILHSANRTWLKSSLQKVADAFKPDAVINFNYDCGFLRPTIFPDVPFVSILNDDFLAGAKPWMKRLVERELQTTCEQSDAVLCVSEPLRMQAMKFGGEAQLFLPWANRSYVLPIDETTRDVVLYYGYVNRRLNWNLFSALAERGCKLRIVGPANDAVGRAGVRRLGRLDTVEYFPAMPLANVQLDDVCCSIAPYDVDIATVRACTVSNRVFQLLARGLPFLVSDLPYFISAPENVIRKYVSLDSAIDAIEYFKTQFWSSQDAIRKFLESHQPVARYGQLVVHLNAQSHQLKP